jgi:alpha-tubulin suppressor-like RCC1 family protein
MGDETARCWGSGSSGQLGAGRSSYSVPAAPVLESGTPTSSPVTLSAVSSLSTGYLQSCVVRTTGEIRCSGYSQWGMLGDGTVNTTRRNPVRVLASGTELSSPVPFGGSISVAPATITVEVTNSGASSSSVTVILTSR